MRFVEQTGIGVVVPHDMALDRELWRWVPEDVTLHLTRTRRHESDVGAEMIAAISDSELVAGAVRDLATTEAAVHAYACTSGSFIRGTPGERALAEAMRAAGAPAAVTTSGAAVSALKHLGVTRVAAATPYDDELTDLLGSYLLGSDLDLVGCTNLGLRSHIWRVPHETTADLVRRTDRPEADGIFVSCTNLPTYDVIAALEDELGKPVVTANQATMWASLRAVGRPAVGPGQRLLADSASG
ncbi:maleate cis-trans isomerase family protein [Salinifilum ghardaiensis]